MKKIIFTTILIGGIFILNSNRSEAGDKNICFCHSADSNPHTICTSNPALQAGHTNHGDAPFGCECGNNVCEASFGEDCGTCPADCGMCDSCGDGTVDDGEECGEKGVVCAEGDVCIGCRCLSQCGNQIVDFGEACDGGTCCTDTCSITDQCGGLPECQPIEETCDQLDNNCNGEVDEGDVCVAQGDPTQEPQGTSQGSPATGSVVSPTAGGGFCSLNPGSTQAVHGSTGLVMFGFAALSLLLARRWKGTR